MPAGMNPFQTSTFWIWYKSANGDTRRSFTRTSERCGMSVKTISEWHKEFNWDLLAAEKDETLSRREDKIAEAAILGTFKEAQDRQRKIVTDLYERFQKTIAKMPPSSFRVADLLKLMEYETQFMFEDERGVRPQGNLLQVVLQMMPAEARTEFNAAFERARDTGQLQLTPVGLPGRN